MTPNKQQQVAFAGILSLNWSNIYDVFVITQVHKIVTAQLNLNWSWSETLKWVGSHPPHPTHQELLKHFQAT